MSAPAFTPGPWHVILDAFHVGNKRVSSFHPSAIAKVYGDEPKDDDPKSTANARLIAAAPEIYAAAEFLCERLAELECDILDDEVGRQYYGHCAPAQARLSAILAEARGEHD